MSPTTSSLFQIGPWQVHPQAHELVNESDMVRLEPKVMDVLVALAESSGEILSRDALLERVWPDVVVAEDALSSAVSKLRAALGDDARSPRYIETVPKAGYRLIAPVEPHDPAPRQLEASSLTRSSWRWWAAGIGVLALIALAVALMQPEPALGPLDVRELTHLSGIETHPALSRDGQFLAFIADTSRRNARAGATSADLYVQRLNDPAPRRLTDVPEEVRYPTWLPDGRIAFLRCAARACTPYTISPIQGPAQRLSDAVLSPFGLAAPPDGSRLLGVVNSPSAPSFRLTWLDPATGAMEPLTEPPAGAWGDHLPAISPDGASVAFVRHTNDGGQLMRMPLDASRAPSRLPIEADGFEGHAWTEDSRSLVVAVSRGGRTRLVVHDVRGGSETPLPLTMTTDLRAPTVAANRLVAESRSVSTGLFTSVDGNELAPVSADLGSSEQPSLSPDGQRIAHMSDRSGSSELWTLRPDGSDLLRLTQTGEDILGAPQWSPDGEWIAFERMRGGTSAIVAVSASGGTPRAITDGAHYDAAPRWSPDGQTVYFASSRSGSWSVWRVPAVGGTPEQVTTTGVFAAEPSLDGRTLIFNHSDRPGLWRQPLSGGPATPIDSTLSSTDWGNWTVTSIGILAVDRTQNQSRIVRIDAQSGERTVVLDALDGIPERMPALSATPDGRQLVVARVSRMESALILAEPFK